MGELKVFDGSTWNVTGAPSGTVVAYGDSILRGAAGSSGLTAPRSNSITVWTQITDLNTTITLPFACDVRLDLELYAAIDTNSGISVQVLRGTSSSSPVVKSITYERDNTITLDTVGARHLTGSSTYMLLKANDINLAAGTHTYSVWFRTAVTPGTATSLFPASNVRLLGIKR